MKPRGRDLLRSWARTFAVQGSWNYRTMIGGGLAYALAPLLRRIHAGDPVALREATDRHLGAFNAHPYLSALAVGAIARAEQDGAPPERILRFREALQGPLGSLGDRAVWAVWRPGCLLLAVAVWALGATGPVGAAALFLALYNAGHLWLRVWAFRTGWEAGLDVGLRLRGGLLDRLPGRLAPAVVVLLGMDAALLAHRFWAGQAPRAGAAVLVAAAAAVALGYRWPRIVGRTAILWILLAPAVPWLVAIFD